MNDLMMPKTDTENVITHSLEELLASQQRYIDLKYKELQLESRKIESEERIALAEIEAKNQKRLNEAMMFARATKIRFILIGIVVASCLIVLLISVLTEHMDFAIEFSKIGGGILLGYIAGSNKGYMDDTDRRGPGGKL